MNKWLDNLAQNLNRKIFLGSIVENDQESIKVTVDDIEDLKNNRANKSKIKEVIFEKLKRFYYLNLYEKIKIGQANDVEYKEVLKEEIERQEEKKEQFQGEQLKDNIYNASGKSVDAIKNVIEQSKEEKPKINSKIEELNEKVKEIDEKQQRIAEEQQKINEEELTQNLQENVQQIMQEDKEQTLEPIQEQQEEPKEEQLINTEEKIEEVKNENVQEEPTMSEEKKAFMATMEALYDKEVEKLEAKHAIELNQVKEDAANKITEAQNIIKKVTDETNEKLNSMGAELDQYKSHYEQATQTIENQRNQLAEKDNKIDELNKTIAEIPAKDAEIARLREIEKQYNMIRSALSFNQPVVEIEEKGKTL